MKILIVGVGNIGKRHLESLTKYNKIKQFHIVEKNNLVTSILKTKYFNKKFFFHKAIDNLDNKIQFDLAILSTNSDVRFKIFTEIVRRTRVKFFILEKFVFQNINHFNYANKLIRNKNLKVFINCPMRTWPFFENIKKKYYKSEVEILMTGSKWGLASNAIHYIDLLIHFTNKKKIYLSKNQEMHIYKSKRKNFVEFGGILDAKIDKSNFLKMVDNYKQKSKPKLYIKFNEIFFEIDAGRNYYFVKKFKIKNNQKKFITKNKFKTPLQSQMTLKIFKDIKKKKKIQFPLLMIYFIKIKH